MVKRGRDKLTGEPVAIKVKGCQQQCTCMPQSVPQGNHKSAGFCAGPAHSSSSAEHPVNVRHMRSPNTSANFRIYSTSNLTLY